MPEKMSLKNIEKLPWLQHAIAIGLFILVSVIYFRPILEGKSLYQNDVYQSTGATKEAKDYHKKTGEYVGWSNSMFSGMPTSVGRSSWTRNFFINLPYGIGNLLGYYSFDLVLWLMIGMYILLTVVNINYWLRLVGAVSFSLLSFNVASIEGGHVMKVMEFAFIVPVMAGMILTYRKKYISGAILLLVSLASAIAINHSQALFYMGIMMGIISIAMLVYAVIKKDIKSFIVASLITTGAFTIAGITNFSMVNTLEQSKLTTRGDATGLDNNARKGGLDKDYAAAWSMGKSESFTYLVPNFFGGSSSDYFVTDKNSNSFRALKKVSDPETANYLAQQTSAYYGTQPFVGGGMYMGIIICVLFIIGLFLMPAEMKVWVITSFIVFMVLSWGHNAPALYDFLFNNLPLYNKFRIPAMAVGMVQISMVFSAFYGLNELISPTVEKKKKLRVFAVGSGVVGGLLLLMLALPDMFASFVGPNDSQLPSWFVDALVSDRKAVAQKDTLRSLAFAALFIGLAFLFLKEKIKSAVFIAGVALLCTIDVWGVATRFINADKFKDKKTNNNVFALSPAENSILADRDPNYRVLNVASGNPFSDAITSYHFKSVGGYHGAKLRRYQELIEKQLYKNNLAVLNMLNVKYFIFATQEGQKVAQRNEFALGNAWFVDEIKIVNNADEEMNALTSDSTHFFNPRKTAIIHKEFESDVAGIQPSADSLAYIKLLDYAPIELNYESNASTDRLAVFSEIDYLQEDGDGWHAYIDDAPVKYIRANYVLRALKIPAGKHKISFFYESGKAVMRYNVSFIFSIITCIIIGVLIFLSRKEKYKPFV